MRYINRDQRKVLEKAYRKVGKSRAEAKEIAKQMYDIDKIRLDGVGDVTRPQKFNEDDKFMLDIEKIRARKNYNYMTDNYKRFVSENVDTVFTAHVESRGLISAKEEPMWLFWSGDLLRVAEVQEEVETDKGNKE